MGNNYRFSPIEDEKTFRKVLIYIQAELDKLSNKLFGKSLPITTLKVFPHYPEEYGYLMNIINKIGERAAISSVTSHYVKVNEMIGGSKIKYIGVRIVDPYRLQAGCGDYEIEDYEDFKKKNLGKSIFVRSFREDMLELWHPDFDVLGYVIQKDED